MSKIELPEEMDEERAEKILKQRAKSRLGSKSAKRSTKNKAGENDSSDGLAIVFGVLALVLWALSELGISLF